VRRQAERIAAGSILVGAAVLALKGAAWWLTGSAALYSDALETVVNVAASVVALVALHFAAKPADANHPYGHDKAEFFSAVVEGVLIVVAAASILQEAWHAWWTPRALDAPWPGIALNLAATALNGGWAAVLLRAGRRYRSAALDADGRHLLSDVATSVGITAGLVVTVLTGVRRLDAVLAAATALYVLWTGLRLMRDSVGGLMDQAPAAPVVERIRRLVGDHAAGAIEAHDLRTRHAGRVTFLEFHLVVPGDMRVAEAHAICDRIEAALRAEVEGMVVTIHVEPEAKAKHHGVVVL
jgi:cation diffusion facilitator family transporter